MRPPVSITKFKERKLLVVSDPRNTWTWFFLRLILRELNRPPVKIRLESTLPQCAPAWWEKLGESLGGVRHEPVVQWLNRKSVPLAFDEPFGTGGKPGPSARIRQQARDKGGKCIVHGCEAESAEAVELYSLSVKVKACVLHAELLRQLDGDALEEILHPDSRETSSLGRIVAYEEVFPDFDDGESTPPATQAAMKVSDGAFIRHFELLEAGYTIIASEDDDGRLEVEWIDPYVVYPYDVELEEVMVGEIMTALAPHERPDHLDWALNKNKKEDDVA